MIRSRLLVVVALVLAGRAAGQDTAKALYPRMLQATCWIHNKAGNDNGTGWVVDRAQRLVVTNWHVVVKADAVSVTFPAYQGGKVVSERPYYLDPKNNVPSVSAQVIETDSRHDLALL